MRIAVGSDHRGFKLKQTALAVLGELEHQADDLGCYDETSVDYPDVAQKVAKAVSQEKADLGILICATGIGMSMTANKVQGVRAALCSEVFDARMARAHNDANILCMGGSFIGEALAREIIQTFLSGSFEGGRHARRVNKITALEKGRSVTTEEGYSKVPQG